MESEPLPSDDDFQENTPTTPFSKGSKDTKSRLIKGEIATPLKKSMTPVKRTSRRRIVNDE